MKYKKSCTKKNKRTRRKRGGTLTPEEKAKLRARLQQTAENIKEQKTNLSTSKSTSKPTSTLQILVARPY